jgi:predicted TPR repeat methyltransferase
MVFSNFIGLIRSIFEKLLDKFKASFGDKNLKEAVVDLLNKAKYELIEVRKKMKNLEHTNYDLGMYHYNSGNLSDAIFRFKMLKKIFKVSGQIDYFIGRCYIERNQIEKAKPYIESYLKGMDTTFREEAKYCYDLAYGRIQNIKAIPQSIVKRTFNLLAEKYDEIFFSKPNLPQDEVYKQLNAYVNEVGSPYGNKVLDLGCGTGYIAKMLKSNKVAGSIVGVDFSSKMIEICKALKIDHAPCYDILFEESFESYFSKEIDKQFDIIIASKIISYFNDPLKLLTSCKEMLKTGGVIALTYKVSSQDKVRFDSLFEEFQFDEAYVAKVALDCGLSIKSSVDVKFPDGDNGKLMLLIKV